MEEYIIHILYMYITYCTSYRKWFDIVALRFYSYTRICNFLFVQYISSSLIHLHPFLPLAFLIAVRLIKGSSVLFFFIAKTRANY